MLLLACSEKVNGKIELKEKDAVEIRTNVRCGLSVAICFVLTTRMLTCFVYCGR